MVGADDHDILEAKKDGVLLRDIDETLEVDAFLVLRPKLSATLVSQALDRARTHKGCLLYTSPSPRDATLSRMPSSA